jgi:hypothetical protein
MSLVGFLSVNFITEKSHQRDLNRGYKIFYVGKKMTWLSKEELEKIALFKWKEEEIKEFISEFLIFSPKERRAILDDMIEKFQGNCIIRGD